jgi:heat shock protein 5
MASARRPTRNQATTLFSSFSVFFLALICLLALCPSAVRAEQSEQSVPEYGSVIGIGEYHQNY